MYILERWCFPLYSVSSWSHPFLPVPSSPFLVCHIHILISTRLVLCLYFRVQNDYTSLFGVYYIWLSNSSNICIPYESRCLFYYLSYGTDFFPDSVWTGDSQLSHTKLGSEKFVILNTVDGEWVQPTLVPPKYCCATYILQYCNSPGRTVEILHVLVSFPTIVNLFILKQIEIN